MKIRLVKKVSQMIKWFIFIKVNMPVFIAIEIAY